jgi:multidrug efflux pump subunit AcrB
VAIMGGLITSSLLSLIVVPVLYTLVEDFWKQNTFKSRF